MSYTTNLLTIQDEEALQIYDNYRKYGDEIDDNCCGHTDTSPPTVVLLFPPENSINLAGTNITIKIVDDNFMEKMNQILYSWDMNPNISVTVQELDSEGIYNFILPTGDGFHFLYLYAEDYSGNWLSKTFRFKTGIPPPKITLNYPTNNSVVLGGSTIDLSITDSNANITQVLYNWDNALTNTTLAAPYDLVLPNDNLTHDLKIYAENDAGSWISVLFRFTATQDTSAVSIAPTDTTTTSNLPPRRTSGFLFLSLIGAFIAVIAAYRKQIQSSRKNRGRRT